MNHNAKPKACVLLGNGLTYDFYNWIAPDSNLDPYDLLAPARSYPCAYPEIAKLIDTLGSNKSDSELIPMISEYLRSNAGGLLPLKALEHGPPAARDTIGHGKAIDPEMQFRQCMWEACRNQDRWIESKWRMDPIHAARWQWASTVRNLVKYISPAFVSYNYDRVPTFLLEFAFPANIRHILSDGEFNFFNSPDEPRLVHFHGNIRINQTAISPNMSHARNLVVVKCNFSHRYEWPLSDHVPYAPDLIPPGFALAACLLNCSEHNWNHFERILRSSDLIIAAGLSLSGIDKDEFLTLGGLLLSGKTFIHCTLVPDLELSRNLEAINCKYIHVNMIADGHRKLLEVTKRFVNIPL